MFFFMLPAFPFPIRTQATKSKRLTDFGDGRQWKQRQNKRIQEVCLTPWVKKKHIHKES